MRGVRSESGFVLAVTAMAMGLFVIVSALVLDFGRMWIYSTQLQSAADAAALAGASAIYCRMEVDGLGNVYSTEYFMDPVAAENEALNVLNLNLAHIGGVTPVSHSISVHPANFQVDVAVAVKAQGVLIPATGDNGQVTIGRQASARFVPPVVP